MPQSRRWLVAHLSDLHLDGTPDAMARSLAIANYLRSSRTALDAIVVTGDVGDRDESSVRSQVRGFVDALPADVPVASCSGNADFPGAADLARSLTHAELSEGLRIVPVDNDPAGALTLDPTAVNRAHEVLRALPADARVLLAVHVPPAPLHGSVQDQLLSHERSALDDLARHQSVIAVLAGHTHTATVGSIEGKPLLIAPGVRSAGRLPHLEVADVGDRLLDIEAPPALFLHSVVGRTISSYVRHVV